MKITCAWPRFQRATSTISAHKKKRSHFTKTQSKPSSIGQRRKPDPKNQPGYLRVDTVHQGGADKKKGVYHVDLVDEVTPFEISL